MDNFPRWDVTGDFILKIKVAIERWCFETTIFSAGLFINDLGTRNANSQILLCQGLFRILLMISKLALACFLNGEKIKIKFFLKKIASKETMNPTVNWRLCSPK